MTQEELRRLELNLTKSALKAKPGYVRMMLGLRESDQGFGPLEGIKVFNYLQDKETTLAEFIEDVKKLKTSHDELFRQYQEELTRLKEQDTKMLETFKALELRIKKLEEIQAENDSFVLE